MKTLLLLLLLLLLGILRPINAFALDITSHGITWTISGTPASGTFCTGDPWVVGPVTITAITRPNAAADKDGSMFINGLGGWGTNGFDSRSENVTYVAGQNVANSLPLVVDVNKSLVSSISHAALRGRCQLDYQAVLTVLPSAPAAGSFRPCYAGTNKAVTYNKSQIDYTKLQNLAPVGGTPGFEYISEMFRYPIISVGSEYPGVNYFTAWYNCPLDGKNYGREFSYATSTAALLLNLNYTNAQKEELAIRYIQYGLDIYGSVVAGMRYYANAGHSNGRKIPMMMAGVLLNDSAILAAASGTNNYFSEDIQHFYVSQNDINTPRYVSTVQPADPYPQSALGLAEWGPAGPYPNNTAGYNWGRTYRHVVGPNLVGTALAVKIMGRETTWNDQAFIDYYIRFVSIEGGNGIIDGFAMNMWNAYSGIVPAESTVAAIPVAVPGAGGYNSPQSITLSTPTAGASIYYTTNGSTPTAGSTLYTSPIAISASTTLKAIAIKSGLTDSSVLTADYVYGPYFSSSTWYNAAIPTQTESFTATWLSTPGGNNIDAVTAFAESNVPSFSGTAVAIRFNTAGNIDARNGGSYTAVNTMAYSSGVEYLFELDVNMINNTYSLTVTADPNGTPGTPTAIAANYAFRTEAANVAALNVLALIGVSGSHAVDDVTFGSSSPVAVAPTWATVQPGSYSTTQSVTLSTTTPDAAIRYTVDGSDPTSGSTAYSTAISVAATTTIKARTFAAGFQQSNVLTGIFTVEEIVIDPDKVQPVLVDVGGGTYGSAQAVTPTSNTSGATIYYTTNGSTPTTGSTEYTTGTIAVSATATLKFLAVKTGMTNSDISTYNYVIGSGAPEQEDDIPVTPALQIVEVAMPRATYPNRVHTTKTVIFATTGTRAVVGMSPGSTAVEEDLAVAVGVDGGFFRARRYLPDPSVLNTGTYEWVTSAVAVTAGVEWEIRINKSPATYSAQVRAPAGSWQTIASNFEYRAGRGSMTRDAYKVATGGMTITGSNTKRVVP